MFSVLGASGFIGSHLIEHFRQSGITCFAPRRNDSSIFTKPLGNVIYCIGLTADFRRHPLEAAEAHVGVLVEFLKRAQFDSFLYLSSTRLYEGAAVADEMASLAVNPSNPNHVFNLTKLAGEACCLSQENPRIRIARLSNVLGDDYASDNFVFSVLRDAIQAKRVTVRTAPDSAKDYIWIEDVVSLLPQIALQGRERIYNLASGVNLDNRTLLDSIARLSGAEIHYAPDAELVSFPPIQTERICREFGYVSTNILDRLDYLYEGCRSYLRKGKPAKILP